MLGGGSTERAMWGADITQVSQETMAVGHVSRPGPVMSLAGFPAGRCTAVVGANRKGRRQAGKKGWKAGSGQRRERGMRRKQVKKETGKIWWWMAQGRVWEEARLTAWDRLGGCVRARPHGALRPSPARRCQPHPGQASRPLFKDTGPFPPTLPPRLG